MRIAKGNQNGDSLYVTQGLELSLAYVNSKRKPKRGLPYPSGLGATGHWRRGVLQGKAARPHSLGGVSKGSRFCVCYVGVLGW
jgi:hypothetical protein